MANKQKAKERAARAAALAEEQRRKAKRAMILRVVGIAVALVLVVVAGVLLGSRGDEVEGDTTAAGSSEYGLTMGDPDAPHDVVIYEDFLCPYCGELERASSERLTELAEQGKVFVDYRPFVLLDRFGPYSEDATNAFAVVKEEAGDEVALEFHKLLFENQPPEDSSSWPDADALVDLAVEAGADEDAVRPGIEDGAQEDWAEGATDEAVANGVEGTPTILLDGRRFQDGATVEEMVDNLVEQLQ